MRRDVLGSAERKLFGQEMRRKVYIVLLGDLWFATGSRSEIQALEISSEECTSSNGKGVLMTKHINFQKQMLSWLALGPLMPNSRELNNRTAIDQNAKGSGLVLNINEMRKPFRGTI